MPVGRFSGALDLPRSGGGAEAYGGSADVETAAGYSVTMNDGDLVRYVRTTAEACLDERLLTDEELPQTWATYV